MSLPRVILHVGMSVDGRIDHVSVDEGLYYELASRWRVDAMLSGSNTILAAPFPEEAPEEWLAGSENETDKQKLVIVDSRGRLRNWHLIKKQPWWQSPIALCSTTTDPNYLAYLKEEKIDYIIAGEDRVDMRQALLSLNEQFGIEVIRVDSGGILNGVLLRAGLVDEVSVLIHSELVGGTSPRSIFVAPDLESSEDVVKLRLKHLEQVGEETVWLRYEVQKGLDDWPGGRVQVNARDDTL